VCAGFTERQVFRIDHYLGKPSVQNLFALRFGNALFEPLWRREHIANIQITIAEELGVEKARRVLRHHRRAARHGAEPCAATAVRHRHGAAHQLARRRHPRRKAQGAASLKPWTPAHLAQHVIRGQYGAGNVAAHRCPAYRERAGVDPHSNTETFVALRTEISNWRWAGVPFYIRTGKRLAGRDAHIVVNFRPTPHAIFNSPRRMPTGW
jgi:glucose-6-phosphate 1-dehydrogenase